MNENVITCDLLFCFVELLARRGTCDLVYPGISARDNNHKDKNDKMSTNAQL